MVRRYNIDLSTINWIDWKQQLDNIYRLCTQHRYKMSLNTLDYIYDKWDEGIRDTEMIHLLREESNGEFNI